MEQTLPTMAAATGNGADCRLEFRDVRRTFPSRGTGTRVQPAVTAVDQVNLWVKDGEVVSLIGPSGCGKSTLLTMAAGLDQPSAGEVRVDGELVDGPNEHVAFMLQKDLLMPWRSIRKNVELGLEIRGVPASDRRSTAMSLLEQCHLKGFEEHYPHQLSGGMRQRAALARTLAMNPDVILLDEPFSALDAQTKMILQKDLAETLVKTNKTAFFITHDLVEAITLSDRVLVMSHRPGRIVEEIVIDIPDRHDPFVRRQHPRIGGYVGRLLELLDLSHAELKGGH